MKNLVILFLLCFLAMPRTFAQDSLEIDGQVSIVASFAPDNQRDLFIGARYIPWLSYGFKLDTTHTIDFEASANISGAISSNGFSSVYSTGRISPYRLWARYSRNQFEFRVGLQKIDFGPSVLLRPLQWFNEIDPRDPLQLTNGVYGALARYYFLNNANVWIWGLYGNEKTRGFDTVETNRKTPEFGGRVQLPVSRGEIAFSYHHRTASTQNVPGIESIQKIAENRIGVDGKWDIQIGLWFEASYIHKAENIGILTNQGLVNVGVDYTFGVGNGLNVMVENLLLNYSEKPFNSGSSSIITATKMVYPLGLFDTVSGVVSHNWAAGATSLFINFEHQFPKVSTYLMGFYNPQNQTGIRQNDLVNTFAGPGLRVMLVYNH